MSGFDNRYHNLYCKQQLEIVRKLQGANPGANIILCGSLGLFVQMVRIPERRHDVDLLVNRIVSHKKENSHQLQYWKGNNDLGDFTKITAINHIKVQQKLVYWNHPFMVVEFFGHMYKCSPIEEIIKWKIKYAMSKKGRYNKIKHLEDLRCIYGG